MSLKSVTHHAINKSSPLYILGAGSIGLFFASCMQINESRIPPCLLLRSHHKKKLQKSNIIDFPTNSINTLCSETGTYSEKQIKLINAPSTSIHELNYKNEMNDGHALVAFKGTTGEVSLLKVPSVIVQNSTTANSSRPTEGFIQNILLCTKAPDAVHAINSIVHLLHPSKKIKIVVMTNGSMGVISEMKEMIEHKLLSMKDQIDIIHASTYHGVHRGTHDKDFEFINSISNNQTFNVLHAGLGQVFIEDKDDLCSTLSNDWNEAGLRSNLISSNQMNILNWKKLAANCAINPLTALRQCKNGELLTIPVSNELKGIESLMKLDQRNWHFDDESIFYQLIREVSNVAIADAKHQGFDDKHVENFQYDNLVQFVEEVVADTAENNSSMYQDILHRRHPTEIFYLNGYVAKLGREEYGLDVCANEYITKEVDECTIRFSS